MDRSVFTIHIWWVSLCLVGMCLADGHAEATTYYVANHGTDANDGQSPDTPWQSLNRVNAAQLKPGDAVLFQRGDMWRGQIRAQSGDESGWIRYGAYGEGAKPLLLGSVERNRPEDWEREGDHVWVTGRPESLGEELLPDPSFSDDPTGWHLYCEGGAGASGKRDTSQFDTAPASYHIHASQPGEEGSEIQFYTDRFSIESGRTYRLSYRAKSRQELRIPSPVLMKSVPPWSTYAQGSRPTHVVIGEDWATYELFYSPRESADDARITFFLGDAMPEDADIVIDSASLVECDGALAYDVGNIIFDNGAVCGVKVWNEEDLREQDQYWYDEGHHVVKIVSEVCPAERYSDIELALTRHIIDESNVSYVTYDNLALMYGAAHGIGGGSTHHITARDCDIGYIGGGDQGGGDRTVRYGNGVEFWGAAHDNLVERCRLWEIYDAALTNQSNGPATPQYNITYRFNVIWNCEYSFEYWNRPETSTTHHIYFENNTCVNAGFGWGHVQRPDPNGRQLCFYTSPASIEDFYVRNNIFDEAEKHAFYAPAWSKEAIDALVMDHNCWYQSTGAMVSLKDVSYTRDEFETYQAEWNKDLHSVVSKPDFVDGVKEDFTLAADSPCVDRGMDLGYESDFAGTPIPQGDAPDIGAFERRP